MRIVSGTINSLCHKIIMELQSPHRNAGRRYDYNDDIVPSSLSSEPLQPYLV